MDRNEKIRRLKAMLVQVAPERDLEALERAPVAVSGAGGGLEAMHRPQDFAEQVEKAHRGVKKLTRAEDLTDEEIQGLEAIVMPRERPVVFIRNGTYGVLPDPWSHLADKKLKKRLEAAIPAIGRVELPGNAWIPYGGTGFVVGTNLLMTNRHVAELFANGLGLRNLTFRAGHAAAVNFKRERGLPDDDQTAQVTVRKIKMIHPFWDMALLEVEGLPRGIKPLTLSIRAPEELRGREVAVIGYPARDDRSDLALQDRIFERVYNVKRLQPGKLRERQQIDSFGNRVNALTHDSSTLGGNSGSAVMDLESGEVVGLHFAGVYLKANYAVPAFELARDSRVVDTGMQFATGRRPPDDPNASVWRSLEEEVTQVRPAPSRTDPLPAPNGSRITQSVTRPEGLTTTWTIPLQVSITLGVPTAAAGGAISDPEATALAVAEVEAMRMQVPIIYDGLETRTGYQAGFLELDDEEEMSLPELTSAGQAAAARLEDGSQELKYHKFSIVMHKTRRMALFTAANVDWRPESHLVNGRKPSRRELTGLPDRVAEEWATDPRIPANHQLPDRFYTEDRGAFDKGHLVRRDDVCWGDSFADIQKANGDTYHTTNCSPQVGNFNRSTLGQDNWGDLEDLVQKQTKAEKAILFSGPVLAVDDPVFKGKDAQGRSVSIQIPRRYWKIIVTAGEDGPEAYGFILEQNLANVPLEFQVPTPWKRYLAPIEEIEGLLNGLAEFPINLKKYDQYETVQEGPLEAYKRGNSVTV